jgi:hypothetical protein
MKTLLLILCSVFTLVTFSCKENPTDNNSDNEIHEIGWLVDLDLYPFPSTMKLRSTFTDTIPILFKDGCVERGYFKVNKVISSTIECTLYEVRPKGDLPCTRGVVPSTAVLQFTPKQRGVNTIKITDRYKTYTKEIVVE